MTFVFTQKNKKRKKACTKHSRRGSVGVVAVVPAEEHGDAPPEDVQPRLVLLQHGAAAALPRAPRRRRPGAPMLRRRRRDEVAVRRADGVGDGGGRELHVLRRAGVAA
ncbi:hypothetical protein VPH35_043298 [Triticum aestivum]|uniref:Uncharacterized protein n=1 Tax=Triticum urartu TaxID=4572 RepID=A0A8R7PP38_TRIUA